jgi:hypothetical protein
LKDHTSFRSKRIELKMPRVDPRFVIGARVQAKAHHVTSLSECHRRYGANAKTKLVNGTVTSVNSVPSTNNKRAVTLITAAYELGGGTIKELALNSRSIKLAEEGSTTNPSNEPVTGLVNGNDAPIDEAIEAHVARVSNEEMLAALESSDEEVEDEVRAAERRRIAAAAAAFCALPAPPQGPAAQEEGPFPVVATVHDVHWRAASTTELSLNGAVPHRQWGVRTAVGDVLLPGAGTNIAAVSEMSGLDFFYSCSLQSNSGPCSN